MVGGGREGSARADDEGGGRAVAINGEAARRGSGRRMRSTVAGAAACLGPRREEERQSGRTPEGHALVVPAPGGAVRVFVRLTHGEGTWCGPSPGISPRRGVGIARERVEVVGRDGTTRYPSTAWTTRAWDVGSRARV